MECENPDCKIEINEKFSEVEIEVAKKINRDGTNGAFNIFQKIIPWKVWLPIIVLIGSAIISAGYNVYSSEFKFADKESVSEFKEETKIEIVSVKKDIVAINKSLNVISKEQITIRKDMNQSIIDIKKIIEDDNKHQKELSRQQIKSIEQLIKSFHREENEG